jgi:hypothetical protein
MNPTRHSITRAHLRPGNQSHSYVAWDVIDFGISLIANMAWPLLLLSLQKRDSTLPIGGVTRDDDGHRATV